MHCVPFVSHGTQFLRKCYSRDAWSFSNHGGNLVKSYLMFNFQKMLLSRDVFCTLGPLSVLVWLFIILPFVQFKGVKKETSR